MRSSRPLAPHSLAADRLLGANSVVGALVSEAPCLQADDSVVRTQIRIALERASLRRITPAIPIRPLPSSTIELGSGVAVVYVNPGEPIAKSLANIGSPVSVLITIKLMFTPVVSPTPTKTSSPWKQFAPQNDSFSLNDTLPIEKPPAS